MDASEKKPGEHKQIEASTPIAQVFRLTPLQTKALARRKLETIHDLLYYFPTRHVMVSDLKQVKDLEPGDHALLYGKISGLDTKKIFRSRIPTAEGVFEDDSGTIKVMWFHQPYIAKLLPEGAFVKMEGKVSEKNGKKMIANPEYERLAKIPVVASGSLFGASDESGAFSIPVYPETKGLTSRWLYHAIRKIIASGALDTLDDPLPEELRKRYSLPSLKTALIWMHEPRTEKDNTSARKRFSFEEIFLIQVERAQARHRYEEESSFIINRSMSDVQEFLDRFPFAPTNAQKKAIEQILEDFSQTRAMSRLLEGDVGSGKTAVAATTAFAVATTPPNSRSSGTLQTAYMAPTEILAMQHFESFIEYFKHLPLQIGLITSSGCKKFPSKLNPETYTDISRAQLLRWVANGEIAILIGTHSLIQKSVEFQNLAYVVIDEQHRFGVRERMKLARKNAMQEKSNGAPLPHLLSMTATPIPRTLALTLYGDLDLTLLDELPKGRKPVLTELVTPTKRERVYEEIRERLKEGRQLYVICPRIEEPDPSKERALALKSVKEESRRLKRKVFPEFTIGELHGKMTPEKKEEVMEAFARKEIDILVATSVIEVGISVANATMIIIEGAERFGLAQLHQLRGRVMRSAHQPYCYLFADSKNEKTFERLSALQKASSGFDLAELDLQQRGTGELSGARQSGLSDVGMEALQNLKMVEAARSEAQRIVQEDPALDRHAVLKEALEDRASVHFE